MRLWPSRRRAAGAGAPSDDVLLAEDLLRRNVEDLIVVRGRELRGGIISFTGDLLTAPGRALDLLVQRFGRFGYTPVMRTEGDGVVIQAWPTAATVERPRRGLAALLFLLTCVSTLVAGAHFVGSPTFDALARSESWHRWLAGLPFAMTLLAVLGVHEFGHYFTARHYGASVSLPYFIPVPPPFLFGTLGAIIKMRSPARDRNALFDIAVAGPLAGLAVALPAMMIGLDWSRVRPIPPGQLIVFGQSLLTNFLVYVEFGPIPPGMMLYTHPVADAAWVGLFVTALNLFPVGQLDGGRIAYALFGRRHRLVGLATFGALIAMGVLTWSLNWFVWAALIFFLVGFRHGPPLDDVTPLTPGRRAVGYTCLVLLVLLTPPIPLSLG